MEKRHLKGPGIVLVTALVLSGCGGLGKMNKYAENIRYTVDPNPLIVQGDSVAINISGNFPGKYFHRRAMVDLTPTLVYTGGETPAKTMSFQGDKAAGNHTVVPYDGGKAFTYNHKVAYTPAMAESDLVVRIVGRQGNKERTFDDVKIADGVMTTPFLVQPDDRILLGADRFERVTAHTQEATIHYLVNSSVVRPGEVNSQDVREMANFIRGFAKRGNINLKGFSIDAWASPEGELSLNENLAKDRARSAQGWARGEFNRARVEAARQDAFFQLNPRGEDWEGFKREMQKSNIADRDLVLRVLEMYPDVAKREAEIRNMAATYNEIAEDILPRLRRSEMDLNYEIVGKTDEQITALSRNNPDSLNAEELLFAATLSQDLNEQMRIYREAERIYPQDYRGANNVGYIYMMQNRIEDAEAQFQKANSIEDNPYSTNNLGVIARLKGDKRRAAELYGKAMEAGPDVKYNMGIVNIQQGDYGAANSNMSGQNTHNAALAKLLSGDVAGAQRALDESPDKDTAHGHYLAAVIAARQNNGDKVRSELGSAVQKDESLREKAMKDLEFRQFKGQLGI
jgi:Flp pilus assembly protein TadD